MEGTFLYVYVNKSEISVMASIMLVLVNFLFLGGGGLQILGLWEGHSFSATCGGFFGGGDHNFKTDSYFNPSTLKGVSK